MKSHKQQEYQALGTWYFYTQDIKYRKQKTKNKNILYSKSSNFYHMIKLYITLVFFFFFFCLFSFSRAAPPAYGGSQARGPIGAVAPGLNQGHSNPGSKQHR